MTSGLDQYIRRAIEADSEIESYKLVIDIERELGPAELLALVNETRGRIRLPALANRLTSILQLSIPDMRDPQLYEGERFGAGVTRHRYGVPAACPAQRLMLVFCSTAQLPFGPVARLLQYFPADRYDVVVLRDPSKRGFSSGIEGVADTFVEAVTAIRDRFGSARTRDVLCLGTSGGGGPALVAARLLGARAGVSFGGRLPTSSDRYGESEGARAMDAILHARAGEPGSLHAVYSRNNVGDVRKSGLLAAQSGAEEVVIDEADEHNVLHRLHVTGRLGQVLRRTGLLY